MVQILQLQPGENPTEKPWVQLLTAVLPVFLCMRAIFRFFLTGGNQDKTNIQLPAKKAIRFRFCPVSLREKQPVHPFLLSFPIQIRDHGITEILHIPIVRDMQTTPLIKNMDSETTVAVDVPPDAKQPAELLLVPLP